ncbi:nucleotidyltransferase family protein [Candidatus Bathyarchaeota archaeon]|nr:nucleotidyltransferase family protein [Candidatus Bathyarchaeota archaeon]
MIAVILAGGFAVRLHPITRDVAKPLLPIGGKPIIDHIVEKLMELEEVTRIIISTNRRFEEQFKEWLSREAYERVEVEVEPSLSEGEKLGAIGALSRLLPRLERGGGECIIIAGDNLFTSNLKGLIEYYKGKRAPTIAAYDVGGPELARRFSTLETDAEGRVLSFKEKPESPRSSLIGTCIYILPREALKEVKIYLGEGNNPDSPGHFIEWLSKRRELYAYVLEGYWCDVGTPEAYEEAIRKFREMPPR